MFVLQGVQRLVRWASLELLPTGSCSTLMLVSFAMWSSARPLTALQAGASGSGWPESASLRAVEKALPACCMPLALQ